MSNVAIYDPNSTPQKILSYLSSVNTPDYSQRPDVLIDPDLSSVGSNPIRYWKHVAGAIQLMTLGERNAVDVAIAAALTSSRRTGGKDLLDSIEGDGIILRAVADIIKDELNILRQWLVSFKTEVAAASNLADLKTRVAGLPATPDRTLAQLRTAIDNRIDTGSVDS